MNGILAAALVRDGEAVLLPGAVEEREEAVVEEVEELPERVVLVADPLDEELGVGTGRTPSGPVSPAEGDGDLGRPVGVVGIALRSRISLGGNSSVARVRKRTTSRAGGPSWPTGRARRREPLEQPDRLEEPEVLGARPQAARSQDDLLAGARRPAAHDALALLRRRDELAEGVDGGVEGEEALEHGREEVDARSRRSSARRSSIETSSPRTKPGWMSRSGRTTRRAESVEIPSICCRVTDESAKS